MELKKKKLERHEPSWDGDPNEFFAEIKRNEGGDIPAGFHYLNSNDPHRGAGDLNFLICRLPEELENWVKFCLGDEFYLKLIRRSESIAFFAMAENIIGGWCIAEFPALPTESKIPLASIEEIGFEFPS